MDLPKKFTVIYSNSKGENVYKYTNDGQTAFKWEYKYKGTTYIDLRYKAKLRLYWYLYRKNEYSQ